jgi:hypothetical protein
VSAVIAGPGAGACGVFDPPHAANPTIAAAAAIPVKNTRFRIVVFLSPEENEHSAVAGKIALA